MPWLPFGLRDKFTAKFNDLCKQHDEDYAQGKCKLCADVRFVMAIGKKGYWILAIPVFLAVNLPQVWYRYLVKRDDDDG
jgi:hypothetical protein